MVILRGLLRPLEMLYRAGLAMDRRMTFSETLPCPVVSIGNIALGGRSKTPMVIHLAKLLRKRGFEVIVLTRGYGRKSSQPLFLTSPHQDFSVDDTGDEAAEIFLRTGATVLVGKDRLANAKKYLAENKNGRRVVLLDDGFQHWAIRRNLDVVLVRREDFSDQVIPLGALREGTEALRRAHLVMEESVDFKKEIKFSAQNDKAPVLGVLTTRAPTSRNTEFIRKAFPDSKIVEMHLPDHAGRTEMLRALEEFTGNEIVVGWKEAVKLFPIAELRQFREGRLNFTFKGRAFPAVLSEVNIRLSPSNSEMNLEAYLDRILAKP